VPKVDDARAAARRSMERAAGGTNPVAEKRAERATIEANTVRAAVTRYLAHCDRALRPKTATEWRRIFEHDVLPRWGERPIASIGKADVLELVHDKAARRERRRQGFTDGAAVQAGKMLTRLRTFFGWAVANDLVPTDPTAGVRRPAKEATRDRVLTDDELRAFWVATGSLGTTFGPLFRLMLLTAQRENEVAGSRRTEIDPSGATWEIPGARTKNRKAHVVHLSGLAREVIDGVPLIAGQDLLFSGRSLSGAPGNQKRRRRPDHPGERPVSGFSKAKQRLDQAMAIAMQEGGKPAIAPWTLHDLRRTATTGMARLNVPPHVADKVLNHTAGTIRGVAATYNRFAYLDERKAALEVWGRYIECLVRPGGAGNVFELPRRSA
jgi:integrase